MPDGILELLEIGEHQFAEKALLIDWRLQMCLGWCMTTSCYYNCLTLCRVSASNCANIYRTKNEDTELPPGWAFADALMHKHVNEGFKILSLLKHARDTSTILFVPHTAQCDRQFDEAMRERNRYIKEEGQAELWHRCEKCTRLFRDEHTGKGMFSFTVRR
jgi:hypothetical protein